MAGLQGHNITPGLPGFQPVQAGKNAPKPIARPPLPVATPTQTTGRTSLEQTHARLAAAIMSPAPATKHVSTAKVEARERWVSCARDVSLSESRHRHLLPSGDTTLCGSTGMPGDEVWRTNSKKPKCPRCVAASEGRDPWRETALRATPQWRHSLLAQPNPTPVPPAQSAPPVRPVQPEPAALPQAEVRRAWTAATAPTIPSKPRKVKYEDSWGHLAMFCNACGDETDQYDCCMDGEVIHYMDCDCFECEG